MDADIHREWIEALMRNERGRDRVALERTRNLMDKATRDCLVTGYEALAHRRNLYSTKKSLSHINLRCRIMATNHGTDDAR
jgi:hypothetical protein